MNSIVSISKCDSIVRKRLLASIFPEELVSLNKASPKFAEMLKREKLKAKLDVFYEDLKVTMKLTTSEGIESEVDTLVGFRDVYSIEFRNLHLKIKKEDGWSAFHTIITTFRRHLDTSKKSPRLNNYSFENVFCVTQTQRREYYQLTREIGLLLQVRNRMEMDTPWSLPTGQFDIPGIPRLRVRSGDRLEPEDILGMKCVDTHIELEESEDTWQISDERFNELLFKWKNFYDLQTSIRYLRFGTKGATLTGSVDQKTMNVLLSGLDATKYVGPKRTFRFNEREEDVVGGWDVRADHGSVGTVFRSRNLFLFLVWPKIPSINLDS